MPSQLASTGDQWSGNGFSLFCTDFENIFHRFSTCCLVNCMNSRVSTCVTRTAFILLVLQRTTTVRLPVECLLTCYGWRRSDPTAFCFTHEYSGCHRHAVEELERLCWTVQWNTDEGNGHSPECEIISCQYKTEYYISSAADLRDHHGWSSQGNDRLPPSSVPGTLRANRSYSLLQTAPVPGSSRLRDDD